MTQKALFILSTISLCCLGIYDAYLLYTYAMDVPFWDTWDLMPRGSYKHLFEFYNENMQFVYFFISELVYQIADWNLRYFNFINFAIYGNIVLANYFIKMDAFA